MGVPRYVTVQEVRDEGVTPDQASDERLNVVISRWEDLIDEACGQWFEARELTLELDGTDTYCLWLGVPVISLTSLYLNDSLEALSPELYRVYSRRGFPQDDRRNPRVELRRSSGSIYDSPTSERGPVFRRGEIQKLVGSFGFVEADGSCPSPIKQAVLRMVTREYLPLNSLEALDKRRERMIVEEETDGHRVRYRGSESRSYVLEDLFSDPEVAHIVQRYRSPFRIAAPGAPFRR